MYIFASELCRSLLFCNTFSRDYCSIYLQSLYMYLIECECNQEGADGITCDVETGQCGCKTGWEGNRCEINQGK